MVVVQGRARRLRGRHEAVFGWPQQPLGCTLRRGLEPTRGGSSRGCKSRSCLRILSYTGPCFVHQGVIYLYIGACLLVTSGSYGLVVRGLGGG